MRLLSWTAESGWHTALLAFQALEIPFPAI
jgi:hypothetical protein